MAKEELILEHCPKTKETPPPPPKKGDSEERSK